MKAEYMPFFFFLINRHYFLFIFYFLKYFIYLTEAEIAKESTSGEEREKQVPYRKPDVGLDPGSPGSGPGLKVALNR